MVDIKLVDLTKEFGDTVAVDHVKLHIAEGEFFTLLGPSGCGKTTTLRLIAGFYPPSQGQIYFGDRLMNRVPPHRRNTGMVFQNYALWPHMTVFENIAYGLRVRKVPRDEVGKKVEWALNLVALKGMERRFPSQLSGGQQQRIALARALVIEPQVLLLDEPLSNLDAKLRVEMRTEIKKIQKQLRTTTFYVTHDQEEALCISDRLAVMNKGRLEQVGSPREIYEDPRNQFVADFIGVANFMRGRVSETDEERGVIFVETENGLTLEAAKEMDLEGSSEVLASVRPEAIEAHPYGAVPTGLNALCGVVKLATYLGDIIRYEVEAPWGSVIRADVYNPRRKHIFKEGDRVSLVFSKEDVKLVKV